jgi:hypothetical protein
MPVGQWHCDRDHDGRRPPAEAKARGLKLEGAPPLARPAAPAPADAPPTRSRFAAFAAWPPLALACGAPRPPGRSIAH